MDYNSVSKYGNTAPGEDFAEATIVYFRTEGGTVGNQRSRFPNRFRILDEIMKMEGISQKKRSLEEFVDYAIYVMSRTGIFLIIGLISATDNGHHQLIETPLITNFSCSMTNRMRHQQKRMIWVKTIHSLKPQFGISLGGDDETIFFSPIIFALLPRLGGFRQFP